MSPRREDGVDTAAKTPEALEYGLESVCFGPMDKGADDPAVGPGCFHFDQTLIEAIEDMDLLRVLGQYLTITPSPVDAYPRPCQVNRHIPVLNLPRGKPREMFCL